MASGYTSEIKNLFSAPKFDTMEELELIRQKSNNKRAYTKSNTKSNFQKTGVGNSLKKSAPAARN